MRHEQRPFSFLLGLKEFPIVTPAPSLVVPDWH
jgi:hypothetical protein